MKEFRIIIFTLLLVHTNHLISQIYQYANDLTGNYASIDENCTATSLSQVNGALNTTSCSNGFVSYKFSTPSTWTVNRSAVQFTISPNANFQLEINSINFEARRNNKGPQKFRIAYSIDGGINWVNNGSDINLTTFSSCGSMTSFTWDVPDFTSTNFVIFRLYGFHAVNGTGICQMKNIVVNGAVNYVDEDGDGYAYDADCNDADFTINPSVTEICNFIDDNCNITVDEGLEYFDLYLDSDLDGYGNSEILINTCFDIIPGYSPISGDCDDLNPDINDDAAEVENGLDDDCDGNIDTTFFETGYEIGIFFKSFQLSDNFEDAYIIYPNPTSNYLNIKLASQFSDYLEIIVFSLEGKMMFTQKFDSYENTIAINLNSAFMNGFYIIELKDAHSSYKKLFSVQK